ncbi:pilus assembly protein [Citrobacter sp. Cpo090]|uniref:tight adherence pilus pseudopilin TadF n=1 Tax=Citrobacter sp. Cpo090 TaxID=2985139 RepID=UPI0025761521|nr:tight adherence pilus pseudopilin TadF [Citrobacter sp. Cpo090]MDM2843535.1 pilus assembly protein [Citrobacter sp. Cpo090]
MCKSPTEHRYLFWHKSQASASVEFAFIFPIIVLLGLMLIDFTFHFSAESKLARLSNSMSSMLRERSTLYANNLVVDYEDAKNLLKTVDLLLGSDTLKETVSVRVQTVHFSDTSTKTGKIEDNTKSIDIYIAAINNAVEKQNCKGAFDIRSAEVYKMSPWMKEAEDKGKWAPLYQVTLCTKGRNSLFLNALSSTGIISDTISVSNIVIPR